MVIEGRVNTMSIGERVWIKVANVWPNMSAFCEGAAEMTQVITQQFFYKSEEARECD